MAEVSPEHVDEAVRAAHDAMERAYAPYSNFRVGAAVVSGDRIHQGQNVENASYPIGVCAERNAIAAMVNGGDRRVDLVALVCDAREPTPPCGGCRQALWEFGPDAVVVAETATGGRRKTWRLRELLPDAFGPHNLDR